jgi:hypothetical protein
LRSSWEGSHPASISAFLAGGPGIGRGWTSPRSLLIFSQRFMEGKETPKTLATSLRSMPRSTASSTLSLRSFEYAFMPESIHEAQPTCNPLSEIVHDADLMDEKYARPESEGLDAIVRGMQLSLPDDHALIGHTDVLYEGLYAYLGRVAL